LRATRITSVNPTKSQGMSFHSRGVIRRSPSPSRVKLIKQGTTGNCLALRERRLIPQIAWRHKSGPSPPPRLGPFLFSLVPLQLPLSPMRVLAIGVELPHLVSVDRLHACSRPSVRSAARERMLGNAVLWRKRHKNFRRQSPPLHKHGETRCPKVYDQPAILTLDRPSIRLNGCTLN
jgi:hypothetical protein